MKRSKFSLSHYKLATGNMGYLYPLTWMMVYPGDTFQHSTSMLLRMSPLLAPVMHPITVRIHHWYVPFFQIWEDFYDFITGGVDGNDSTTPPYFDFDGDTVTVGSLHDYLGVPPADYTGLEMRPSALVARAYHHIWNEYYRDQDLQTEATVSTASGVDSTSYGSSPSAAVRAVSWPKDYLTASRPWEQKGTQVTVPIGTTAPIIGDGTQINFAIDSDAGTLKPLSTSNTSVEVPASGAKNFYIPDDGDFGALADLTNATGVSVNDLRLALAIQRFQEAQAQYGSRYSEYLARHGVRGSDLRLQRPLYLGGGRQTISISEVLSTDGSNTGALKGHGIAALRTNRYRKFFNEHGIVMTLASIVPKPIYNNALHRTFSLEVKEDFLQQELMYIGDQEVYNREVYTEDSDGSAVFGYAPRYDELRSMPSSVAGDFRGGENLDHWHLARVIASDPALNSAFITCNPATRIFASAADDTIYMMANHSIQARRPLIKRARNKTF